MCLCVHRYLFKKALLEDALANAELADSKSKQEIASTATVVPTKSIVQTDQPRKVFEDDDEITDKNDTESNLDENIKWVPEDYNTVELSEEEQARLLAEYELEILEREKKKPESSLADEMMTTTTTTEKTKPEIKNIKKTSKKENNKTIKPSQTITNTTTTKSTKNDQKSKGKKIQNVKEDVSSNSDESWEKEFDLGD